MYSQEPFPFISWLAIASNSHFEPPPLNRLIGAFARGVRRFKFLTIATATEGYAVRRIRKPSCMHHIASGTHTYTIIVSKIQGGS
jgi:hypothetical protein